MMRAPAYDFEKYAASTVATYNTAVRRYLKACVAQGQDPLQPEPAWFFEWFARLASQSLSIARRTAEGVRYHCAKRLKPSLINHPRMHEILHFSRAAVAPLPLGQEIIAADHASRFFAAQAYHPKVVAAYGRLARLWVTHATERGISPTAPRVEDVAAFLASFALDRAGSTVRNTRSALSHYFRQSGVKDMARHRDIDILLDGIMRARPARTPPPLFLEDLRAILQTFGRAPLDIRDRCILLSISLGAFTGPHLRKLDRAHVSIGEDGIRLATSLPRRPVVFIGGSDEPEIDVRVWFTRWLDIIGIESGPLFPAKAVRGGYGEMALSEVAIKQVCRRACKAAGIVYQRLAASLRRGFLIRASRNVVPSAVVHFAGLKSLDSLAPYCAVPGRHKKRWGRVGQQRRESRRRSRRASHSVGKPGSL
jgi:integrase